MAVTQEVGTDPATAVRPNAPPTPRWVIILVAIGAELAVSLASKNAPTIGLAHAIAVVAVGLYAVARRNVTLVMGLCAYLVGCEVLWRQVHTPLYYLFAPYAVTLLSIYAIVVIIGGRLGRDARLAFLYFVLLVPAAVTTIRTAGGDARELIAFALSGPAALAAFVAFTSQMTSDRESYRRVLWALFISAVGPLAIAVSDVGSALAETNSIKFSKQSNFITSGGFGPVQVSAVLGLGVLAGVILVLLEEDRVSRWIAGVVAAVFAVQSLLTFSRGGMFSAAIGVGAMAIALAGNRRLRRRVFGIVVVALALGYFFVVPWLTDFTGGAFEKRFSDTQTARTELAADDLAIFQGNVVLGVGPGMTKYQRLGYEVCKLRSDGCADEASSHTEYTRMLSEHGIAGLMAIVVMAMLAVRSVRFAGRTRPFAVAFMAWAIAQMFYANLRVVAVPFAFGIAFLHLRAEAEKQPDEPPETSDESAPAAAPAGP